MLVMKWLVVGLGNPEGKYFETWHNLGFKAAEGVAARHGMEFKKAGNQLLAKDGNLFVLKPLTYMNRSGEAVLALVRKQRIEPQNIIVLVDDLYIDKGRVRVGNGGGNGGHNGIRSINQLLGTNEYIKIKIGIKANPEPHCLANYVLERVPANEREIVAEGIEKSVEAVMELLGGSSVAMVQGRYNTKNDQG